VRPNARSAPGTAAPSKSYSPLAVREPCSPQSPRHVVQLLRHAPR
jgi:hypothetical protein